MLAFIETIKNIPVLKDLVEAVEISIKAGNTGKIFGGMIVVIIIVNTLQYILKGFIIRRSTNPVLASVMLDKFWFRNANKRDVFNRLTRISNNWYLHAYWNLYRLLIILMVLFGIFVFLDILGVLPI
jgi:hypothetical protein